LFLPLGVDSFVKRKTDNVGMFDEVVEDALHMPVSPERLFDVPSEAGPGE
jgi:hypothetical protein